MTEMLDKLLTRCGIDAWGICDFSALPPLLPCRAAARLPRGSASVVAVLLPYLVDGAERRNVARYAVVDDYHTSAMDLLRPVCAAMREAYPNDLWEPFVDSSPIPEVRAAYLAGLGAIGRHGLLIHPRYGAYTCIATIVTTARLPLSTPVPSPCSGCGMCQIACPTGAISASGSFNKTRCRSFLTQKKRDLTQWEALQITDGGMAWGCDACLDACPANKHAAFTDLPAFLGSIDPVLTEENLDSLIAAKAYGYRGKPVLERNLRLIRTEINTSGIF